MMEALLESDVLSAGGERDKQPGLSKRRKGRYTSAQTVVSLTRPRLRILQDLASCQILSFPQIRYLTGLPQYSAQRHMRLLFDGGYVSVVPISRSALAGPGDPNDASLVFGSAPNFYVMTKKGLRYLHETGHLPPDAVDEPMSGYGPKNALFLRHTLLIKDMQIWLMRQARSSASTSGSAVDSARMHHIESWREGKEAVLALPSGGTGHRSVLADAWFVYRFRQEPNGLVLLCLFEADRGTERGSRHWPEKIQGYVRLMASGQLKEQCGFEKGRIVVLTLDATRRDLLAERVKGMIGNRETLPQCEIARYVDRFWFVTQEDLMAGTWASSIWRKVGKESLEPFLPSAINLSGIS